VVTAIWAGAVAVIITDGAEAEDTITVGDTITTTGDQCVILLRPPSWRPLFYLSLAAPVAPPPTGKTIHVLVSWLLKSGT
jgi:hypothetical protein